MKKYVKIIICFVIIIAIAFGVFIFISKKSNDNYTALETYISNIYGKYHLIPEFNNINNADSNWLWDNINTYLWSIPENEKRNSKFADYTYDEILRISKFLYGDNFKLTPPKNNDYMLYDENTNKFGPTAYDVEEYIDYKIEKIEEKNNTFEVTLVSYYIYPDFLGNTPSNKFKIYNISDYKLNFENSTPIATFKDANEDYKQKILNNKDKLSEMLFTIEFDTETNLYHITSCKYLNVKPEDTLSIYYTEMKNTFEVYNIKYDYEELYEADEVLVENFDELTSIYTENALDTYKKEMDLLVFRDNQVYIKAGDINIAEYLKNIKFTNIKETDNSISCTATRTFRKSFSSEDPEYNDTYEISDNFEIIKDGNSWKINEFSYNNITE